MKKTFEETAFLVTGDLVNFVDDDKRLGMLIRYLIQYGYDGINKENDMEVEFYGADPDHYQQDCFKEYRESVAALLNYYKGAIQTMKFYNTLEKKVERDDVQSPCRI
jgi:hypothetical protein